LCKGKDGGEIVSEYLGPKKKTHETQESSRGLLILIAVGPKIKKLRVNSDRANNENSAPRQGFRL